MIQPLALALGTLAPAAALADGVGDYGYHMYDHGWAGMLGGSLMMMLYLGLIVLLVVLVLRWFGVSPMSTPSARSPRGGALQILEERLARGEIDAEEFATRRKALEA